MQSRYFLRFLLVISFLWFIAQAPIAFAGIDEGLARQLKHLAPYEEVPVIITMKGAERPEQYQVQDRRTRDGRLVKALQHRARLSQPRIKRHLEGKHAKNLKQFWIINALAATVRADQVEELAAQPDVKSVQYDAVVTYAAPVPATSNPLPEWNLAATGVPDLWATGQTGKDIVVATMDTGLDPNHPDLAGKWRGGNNSWFDPHGEHTTPYDVVGHGTQVMGLLVGGNSSGYRIGVAPDAKFISAKIFNDAGQSTYSDIHAAFQWLLDPDNDPNTADTPDVVNASWGLPGTNNKCNIEFDTDIRMLKTAGIAVVFAGGNDGPAPATAVSPASSAGVISSGAVDSALNLSYFSSHGPSPCGGGTFPTFVAPGESVFTSDISSTGAYPYIIVSGSSFAAAQVAGIMALLAGKYPNLPVSDLEVALTQSIQDLGVIGADNSYGLGLVNAGAAMSVLDNRPAGSTPQVTSMPPNVAMVGVPYHYQVTAKDADGDILSFSLDDFPAGMSIDNTGGIYWVPGSNLAGQYLVTVRVTDSTGLYSKQPYVVVVANVNDAPVAKDDNYEMPQATSLRVLPDGVLNNDTDHNFDHLMVDNFGQASAGVVTGKPDGSFVYSPPSAGFVGIVTFTYQATDGAFKSAAATVTINVLASEARPLTIPENIPTNIVVNPPAINWQYTQEPDASGTQDAGSGSETSDASKLETPPKEANTPAITSVPITEAKQDEGYSYLVTATIEEGGELVFDLDAAPKGMIISSAGEVTWTPTNNQVGEHLVVIRATGTNKLFATQSYTLVVENVNDEPVANNDTFTLVHGSEFKVDAPGVLKNDTDADHTPLTVANSGKASIGEVEVSQDGSFKYKPQTATYIGPVTFTYSASDGELTSSDAVVSINVIANHVPLVKNDTFTVTARVPGVDYLSRPLRVLRNDIDPDTEFDPANMIAPDSLAIVVQPNNGGTVKVAKDGVINYVPAVNFKGIETFSYNVSDTRGAKSKTAVVRVTLK